MDNINNLNSEEELSNSLFIQREYSLHHLVYELEFSFYDAVKSGNIAEVERLMVPLTNQQHGKLSDHPIRNLQYHLVIGIAFITRFCVEGGMEKEIAYSLSDFYIHKADQCSSIKSIDLLHKKMVYDFTKRMHDSKQTKAISLSISKCIEYITTHLHDSLSVALLAEKVNLYPTYLSTLFKKEMGITITEYILRQKIDVAQNLLKYSDFSYISISNYLSFCSHSYFIKIFKRYVGQTPKEYRQLNYRSHWN